VLAENPVEGRSVPFQLERLITEVRVAPQAKPWFAESVKWLLEAAGFGQIPVKQSTLDAEPVF
jgi:hypothetical protein